jgi:hypothetical protein
MAVTNDSAAPAQTDITPRLSVETNAKGYVQPAFRFVYSSNEEMIEHLAEDYRRAFLAFYQAAQDSGQQIAGEPFPKGAE